MSVSSSFDPQSLRVVQVASHASAADGEQRGPGGGDAVRSARLVEPRRARPRQRLQAQPLDHPDGMAAVPTAHAVHVRGGSSVAGRGRALGGALAEEDLGHARVVAADEELVVEVGDVERALVAEVSSKP